MKHAAFNNGGLCRMRGGGRQQQRGARAFRSRRRGSSAQAMLETALVLPLLLTLLFGAIDGSLVLYTYNNMVQASRTAARVMTLPAQISSDCTALLAAIQNGNGIQINVDPNSAANASTAGGSAYQEQFHGNPDPDLTSASYGPTAPTTPGTGYVYLWPSMAYYDQSTTTITGGTNQPGSYATGFRCDQSGSQLSGVTLFDPTGHPQGFRLSGQVKARVAFAYHPITPLFQRMFPSINLVSESVLNTEYS